MLRYYYALFVLLHGGLLNATAQAAPSRDAQEIPTQEGSREELPEGKKEKEKKEDNLKKQEPKGFGFVLSKQGTQILKWFIIHYKLSTFLSLLALLFITITRPYLQGLMIVQARVLSEEDKKIFHTDVNNENTSHCIRFFTIDSNGVKIQGYEMGQKSFFNESIEVKNKSQKKVLLHFRGNADGNVHDGGFVTDPRDSFWRQKKAKKNDPFQDYVVLEFDYPGKGMSQGTISSEKDIEDYADACCQYALNNYKEVTILGKSLGGFSATHAVKSCLRGKYGDDKEEKIKGLILDATFYDLASFSGDPFLRLLLKPLLRFKMENGENLKAICDASPDFPISIVHGTGDTVVSYTNSQKFQKTLADKCSKLRFYTHEHNHNDRYTMRTWDIINHKPKNNHQYFNIKDGYDDSLDRDVWNITEENKFN